MKEKRSPFSAAALNQQGLTTAILRPEHERIGFKMVNREGKSMSYRPKEGPWQRNVTRRKARARKGGLNLCTSGGFHWCSTPARAVTWADAQSPIMLMVRATGETVFSEQKNISRELTPVAAIYIEDLVQQAWGRFCAIVKCNNGIRANMRVILNNPQGATVIEWFNQAVKSRMEEAEAAQEDPTWPSWDCPNHTGSREYLREFGRTRVDAPAVERV